MGANWIGLDIHKDIPQAKGTRRKHRTERVRDRVGRIVQIQPLADVPRDRAQIRGANAQAPQFREGRAEGEKGRNVGIERPVISLGPDRPAL